MKSIWLTLNFNLGVVFVLIVEIFSLIPSILYKKIIQCLPIVSVEAIIENDGSLLLMKRKNKPAKDYWWFPGGRIKKGETLQEALFREVKEETGLTLTESRLINVYSRLFDVRHDITIAYLCSCQSGEVILNNEHSEYKYFKNAPKDSHPYIIEVINDLTSKFKHYSSDISI